MAGMAAFAAGAAAKVVGSEKVFTQMKHPLMGSDDGHIHNDPPSDTNTFSISFSSFLVIHFQLLFDRITSDPDRQGSCCLPSLKA